MGNSLQNYEYCYQRPTRLQPLYHSLSTPLSGLMIVAEHLGTHLHLIASVVRGGSFDYGRDK
jgi:hypothetical protein